MLFEKTRTERSTVRNQCEEVSADSWETVLDFLNKMFDDPEEFVVLSLAEIKHNIGFVQSAQVEGGLTVQLGIEEENGTRLVEKYCSEEECVEIFREFYN
ncbi:MAG: hypothetical protein K2N56_04760, partial [Oscillospiraceae bacterium]|nr:hypothetical protein [Oscillospiraceae bacterium]